MGSHPDDLELACGGTLARLVDSGHEVHGVRATAVTISAGRPEWLAFPSETSGAVAARSDGHDYLAEAIDTLGQGRDVTITLDLLAPESISGDVSLAAVAADGQTSEDVLSLTAMTSGELADRTVELVGEIARRYRPDAIAITEMFADQTFGEADLASYREATGADEWPMEGGGIDGDHESLGQWRSAAVGGFVDAMAEAAHEEGVDLAVDVRSNAADPAAGRLDSGHDYGRILSSADRLVVWSYVGLSGPDGSKSLDVEALSRDLTDTHGADRVEVSVGLWADDDDLSPEELSEALEAARRGGATRVSVTPASKITERHRDAIAAAWSGKR